MASSSKKDSEKSGSSSSDSENDNKVWEIGMAVTAPVPHTIGFNEDSEHTRKAICIVQEVEKNDEQQIQLLLKPVHQYLKRMLPPNASVPEQFNAYPGTCKAHGVPKDKQELANLCSKYNQRTVDYVVDRQKTQVRDRRTTLMKNVFLLRIKFYGVALSDLDWYDEKDMADNVGRGYREGAKEALYFKEKWAGKSLRILHRVPHVHTKWCGEINWKEDIKKKNACMAWLTYLVIATDKRGNEARYAVSDQGMNLMARAVGDSSYLRCRQVFEAMRDFSRLLTTEQSEGSKKKSRNVIKTVYDPCCGTPEKMFDDTRCKKIILGEGVNGDEGIFTQVTKEWKGSFVCHYNIRTLDKTVYVVEDESSGDETDDTIQGTSQSAGADKFRHIFKELGMESTDSSDEEYIGKGKGRADASKGPSAALTTTSPSTRLQEAEGTSAAAGGSEGPSSAVTTASPPTRLQEAEGASAAAGGSEGPSSAVTTASPPKQSTPAPSNATPDRRSPQKQSETEGSSAAAGGSEGPSSAATTASPPTRLQEAEGASAAAGGSEGPSSAVTAASPPEQPTTSSSKAKTLRRSPRKQLEVESASAAAGGSKGPSSAPQQEPLRRSKRTRGKGKQTSVRRHQIPGSIQDMEPPPTKKKTRKK